MNYGKLNCLLQKIQLRLGSGLVCTYMEILHLGRAVYHRRLAVGLISNVASLIHYCSFENRIENNITPSGASMQKTCVIAKRRYWN